MIWALLIAVTAGALLFSLRMARSRGDAYGWKGGEVIAVTLSAVALLVVLVAGLAVVVETAACENTANKIGYTGEWSFWTDCLVTLPDGSIVPIDLLRYTDIVEP